MKTKIISKILLGLSLVFVLGSAITQVNGESPAIPPPGPTPVVTIYSTGDVTRGKTGSFVVNTRPPTSNEKSYYPYYPYVNFSVSGTAMPGIDYVPLVPPAYIGPNGYGVILVETLPDPRGPSARRAYDVIVTLEPGLGYTIGSPRSAKMTIKP